MPVLENEPCLTNCNQNDYMFSPPNLLSFNVYQLIPPCGILAVAYKHAMARDSNIVLLKKLLLSDSIVLRAKGKT